MKIGISKALVFVRGIRFFLYNNIGMGGKERFVIKSDVTYNAKTVSHYAKFIGIAEMPIDVHLLDGRVCGGMGRHGAISKL